jgi:hypothetical protein
MSVIGPGSLGAINLAGSVAGAVQPSAAEADRAKTSAAQRNAAADVQALASRSLEGVGQADESADRDADGRMPLGYSDAESDDSVEEDDPGQGRNNRLRVADADGVRGRRLDLDA